MRDIRLITGISGAGKWTVARPPASFLAKKERENISGGHPQTPGDELRPSARPALGAAVRKPGPPLPSWLRRRGRIFLGDIPRPRR